MFSETKFVCQVCNRNYTSENDLNKHIKVHKISKAFKCDICLKVFSYKNDLKRHYRIHTGKNLLLVKFVIESLL